MSVSEKVKVVHVVPSLDTGGMENGVINICNMLERASFQPTICCLNRPGAMAGRLKADVQLFNMNMQEGRPFINCWNLIWYFRELRPDIVHTHAWGGGSFEGIVGAKLTRVPVIINGEHGSFFLKSHQVMLQRFLAAMCNITLSVSKSLKERVVKNLRIPPEKIKVIPNGVDTDIFSGRHDCSYLREELKNRFGMVVDEDSIIIGCVGSLKPEKNQMMLLAALERVGKRIENNLKAIFIGDGPDRSKLEQFVKEKGLLNDVVFLGIREDIPQLLSLFNILVSTSISRHEGMSNVILEAMSSGLPIVATRSIGTSELVTEGVTGFLVDDNDVGALVERLILLGNNAELRKKMGRAARRLVEKEFSIIRMVKNYEDLYLDLFRNEGA